MKTDKYEYTLISELISELEQAKEKFGNIPVTVRHCSPIFLNVMPYYYDGGYVVSDVNNIHSKFSSKDYSNGKGCSLREGLPNSFLDLQIIIPDSEEKLNGRSVREIDTEGWSFLCEMENEERQLFNGQLINYQWDKEKNQQKAYLASGEFAYGKSLHEAKLNLIKVYNESNS